MRVGELARRTGVSVRSLRYYEEQGLLSSDRSSGGHRHYTEREIDRVDYLQRLYAAGLSSQAILAMLPCLETASPAASDAAFTRLIEERDKLRAHIAALTRTLTSLDELITHNRTRRAEMAPEQPG